MYNHSSGKSSKAHIKKQILFLGALLSVSFIIATTVFWIYEGGQQGISNFGDVAWWWVVTSTTVGYGDWVPQTAAGRAVGVVAIVIGLFSYTHVVGIILQEIQHRFEKEERGRGSVDFQDHVVICEYTAFADELIQQIKSDNLFHNDKLVIVGSLVNRTPYPEHSFIYGEPINPSVLRRSNISEAGTIFVFSNNRFSDPDTKTLHVVSRIKRINNTAPLYVELHNPNHPLLQEISGNLTVMNSADILQKAIQHQYIDAKRYLDER